MKMSEDLRLTPTLEEEYMLSETQITEFQKNGHLYLKGVASKQAVDVYRPRIEQAVKERNQQTKALSERDTYGKAFIQISNIWATHANVAHFVLARRFAKLAADLMGVDGVRIYHDQALFKEPSGGHTPWHQDQVYWPLDTRNTITLWMPLVDIPKEVGTMTFASASHTKGFISKLEISDESHKNLKEYIEYHQLPQVNYGEMSAGDATFHYGWTLHSAPGNPTKQVREVMTIIYFADGARVIEPDSNARKNDLKSWLPELAPGDLAKSRLNPLVYTRA
ncbi:phytanoyl-CoA dioxygenase family protein [Alicyclobacillus fastidiosus]|uniref:Phytanoyl-CoA dioxygenase family protein n=1 Tax=Alicyclobacillus fastidiosus TaxID=392011 RepID=A0ABY6ZBG2_9BACL|nr:phytanoyl-CoA dioxygenase family protein [Alicyclobacillus fastidiosus]WAH39873.1 phytanoyl-CoA dioxygenase family protein [Alicyclobacillus fastidiosus]GMA61140.1 SnoK protein [Alicyclobacillus fastidiosus]